MKTATLFTNGRSQAVRLPKDCRFVGKEVFVRKFENVVILFPKRAPWTPLVNSLSKFSADFMEDRPQPAQPAREAI
jgi:antitoxin VapB